AQGLDQVLRGRAAIEARGALLGDPLQGEGHARQLDGRARLHRPVRARVAEGFAGDLVLAQVGPGPADRLGLARTDAVTVPGEAEGGLHDGAPGQDTVTLVGEVESGDAARDSDRGPVPSPARDHRV